MPTTLVLIRHGEIVRPTDTSNFDPVSLSERGRSQIETLVRAWPVARPSVVYSSPLPRALETARVLGEAFGTSPVVKSCLYEWAADTSGIPQTEYVALEGRAWSDLDFVPPSGESLGMAAIRSRSCIEAIAERHRDDTIAVAGHGTVFSLVASELKGVRPTPEYKASIGFGHAAILSADSGLRLLRDFAPYGSVA